MNRPDLCDDYATQGWQVLDASHWVISNHTTDAMVTGPASVRAIKNEKSSFMIQNISLMN